MTARKKDSLKRKPQDESEAKLLADVKDPGWHVIGVTGDDEGPGFAYTVGLHHSYRHPEIIVFGLDVPILWRIVNAIGEKVKQGERTAPMLRPRHCSRSPGARRPRHGRLELCQDA